MGCHYKMGYEGLSNQYQTISIPYIKGDAEGKLTAEVIRQMTTSSSLRYVSCGGDLTLQLEIIELGDENIGFRYDRKKKGKLKNYLIPTETRLNIIVEVRVVDNITKKVVRGPTLIRASADFDHDYYASRNGVNVFSLGQLTDIDAAQEGAFDYPLNRHLAEKIVDYVVNSW